MEKIKLIKQYINKKHLIDLMSLKMHLTKLYPVRSQVLGNISIV